MPSPSLDLDLDAASADWVRQDWARLREAGLPSQAQHRGASNRPHVTVLAAAALGPEVLSAAGELAAVLPRTVAWSGLVVFGSSPVVLARLVSVDADVTALVERVRTAGQQTSGRPWVAHVTLSRKLPADRLGEAVAVLTPGSGPPGSLVALRRWDPASGLIDEVAPTGSQAASR